MKLETIVSCRTDIYFDYQLIDAMTGKILVDRVYDKTYKKSNKKNGKNTTDSSHTSTGQSRNGL